MHLQSDSSQLGMVRLYAVLIFDLLSTLKCGRVAAVGYSLVVIGLTLHFLSAIRMTATAKSYHEATPSLEK